jgi:hypothetical protein
MTESNIGLLNEKSLHAALKSFLSKPGDRFEVNVDGYIIDIVRGDILIEIQTGNFTSIRSKIIDLVSRHPLRLVYPIAKEKWILKLPTPNNPQGSRRKSPKKGQLTDIFYELVAFPDAFCEPNFSLEILLIQEEETRYFVGKRRWRSNGWATKERKLIKVLDRCQFNSPASLLPIIPSKFPSYFTTLEIAEMFNVSRNLAQKIAYFYRKLGLFTQVGKRSHSKLYTLTQYSDSFHS